MSSEAPTSGLANLSVSDAASSATTAATATATHATSPDGDKKISKSQLKKQAKLAEAAAKKEAKAKERADKAESADAAKVEAAKQVIITEDASLPKATRVRYSTHTHSHTMCMLV